MIVIGGGRAGSAFVGGKCAVVLGVGGVVEYFLPVVDGKRVPRFFFLSIFSDFHLGSGCVGAEGLIPGALTMRPHSSCLWMC